jgi:hypothetical protein
MIKAGTLASIHQKLGRKGWRDSLIKRNIGNIIFIIITIAICITCLLLYRVWKRNIKYDVRKNFADSRVRVKGRFVRKDEEVLLR